MDRVYVANLPPDIRIKDIDDFFRPFGKLVFIDVNSRANPVYAHVQFDSARNAFNAVKARHGYDYEGYTLQLRLLENEVRKRRDATPPPPPPLFNSNNYERPNSNGGLANNYNSSRTGGNFSTNSSISNWFNGNRSEQLPTNNYSSSNLNMGQTNMVSYPIINRSNIGQQFSNAIRSNMQQQQFSNASDYFNSNRSNMNQQFSDTSRSNMSQPNNFESYRDRQQYTNTNRSNIPQLQNLNIQNPNDNWNVGNNNVGWNNRDFGNNNFGNNNFNNSQNNTGSNAPPLKLEKNFTGGLSGAGRRWFDRFIRQGFTPEVARAKALERRTLPYLRDEHKKEQIANNPTNVALETIGNTIINLLSSSAGDNNVGGSRSVQPQQKGNPVSKRQYQRSIDILKEIGKKRVKTEKDRISQKYHTQIVKDYEKFNKINNARNRDEILRNNTPKSFKSGRSEEKLRELMTQLKAKLTKSARALESEAQDKKRGCGAFKKRIKLLMNYGFLEIEAKSLAWNHIDKLEELLALKQEYDIVTKKTCYIPPADKKSSSGDKKSLAYKNDLAYLEKYSKKRIKDLSKIVLRGLRESILRIHDYEKSRKIPLTENKFTILVLKITSRRDFFKDLKKPTSIKKEVRTSTTTDKEQKEKTKVDNKNSETKKDQADENVTEDKDQQVDEGNEDHGENQIDEENQDNDENQDNEENQIDEENQDNEDNQDGENGDNEGGENEYCEDEVIEENEDEENQDNDETEEHLDGNEEEYDDAENEDGAEDQKEI